MPRYVELEIYRREGSIEQGLENLHRTRDRDAVDAVRDIEYLREVGGRNLGVSFAQDRAYLLRSWTTNKKGD
jgi:hypothetical protein